ncbi:hypothetical protein HUG17_5470 [Dermatophagoides farinae]|uniref:Uncharacterized protein n=1 Tax=Dermatophagoides farinae TaxID=6954 RepID=A0A9D4P3K6_DERFA|nr:uncharacterized protein LOC124492510 [Dermatophagoides farinae]KAH7642425.1 hypothetical protein HUG17_5470 [Dermatophagoides farinae]
MSSMLLFFWILLSFSNVFINTQDYYYEQNLIIPLRQCYLDYECPFANSECEWYDQANRQRVCKCIRGFRWNGQQCIRYNNGGNHHDGCWDDWSFNNCTPLMTISIITLLIVGLVALFVIVTCIIVSCAKK